MPGIGLTGELNLAVRARGSVRAIRGSDRYPIRRSPRAKGLSRGDLKAGHSKYKAGVPTTVWAVMAQLVRLATGWTVREFNPGGGEIFRTRPDPASCTMGTGSFPWVKRPGRGVDHSPQSSAEAKGRVELYPGPYLRKGLLGPGPGRQISSGGIFKKSRLKYGLRKNMAVHEIEI
jgi:hypothetical protein